MLYFNLIEPIISKNKNLSDEEIEEEIRKAFRMKGLILSDLKVIKMMDNKLETGASKSIPVSLDKSGNISQTRSSVLSKEEFASLQKKIRRLIKQIADEILSGRIEIKPTYNPKPKKSSCEYCPYKTICGFNPKKNVYEYVPNKTRELVINKAKELNYKGLNTEIKHPIIKKRYRILLLSGKPLSNINFFLPIIRGIENFCYDNDFELFQYTFNNDISSYESLKQNIEIYNVDGIITIETFEREIISTLLRLKKPLCFIDFSAGRVQKEYGFDIIQTNNREPFFYITKELIRRKKITKFTYVGDPFHCLSFQERYLGMMGALYLNGIYHDKTEDILKASNFDITNHSNFKTEFFKLKNKPQCIMCCNDFIARAVCKALKSLNIRVPEDIMVVGYDNSQESISEYPKITTVSMNKEYIGVEAMKTLIERIETPNAPTKKIIIDSTIIYRDTTNN